MKIKKFNKKLGLNKSTVANLNNSEMGKVYGGDWTDPGVCIPTYNITNCATDCFCGTLAETCPTVGGGSCPPTRKCW